jgi:hypothetical protein
MSCNGHNHSPDCTCDFRGGHSGVGGGGNYGGIGFSSRSYSFSERFKDVCHPTHCPECGKEVYFIRHNGGSVWVNPPLGWPWPKHGCFDEPSHRDSYSCIASLTDSRSSFVSPNLALVNQISCLGSPQGPKLQIGCLDGTFVLARGTPDLDYNELLGELVILSREDGLIRHAKLGDFQITILTPADAEFEEWASTYRIRRDTELKTKCPCCNGSFYEDEREEHMKVCPRTLQKLRPSIPAAKNYVVRPKPQKEWIACPKCKCWVEKKNLPGHLSACRGMKSPQVQKKKQIIAPVKESKIMLQLKVKHEAKEKKIVSAFQRIVKEAWLVAEGGENPDERFRLAKHEAIRLVHLLSPHIRREVEYRFTSQKWQPLLNQT